MSYITEQEFAVRMAQIERKNKSLERKRKLQETSKLYKRKFKPLSTSKWMAVYLFLALNIVLAYSMIAMWHFQDLTYLGVLVTDIAGQVLTYFIYTKKSIAENTSGDGTGITFQAMMNRFNAESSDSVEEPKG